MGQLKELIKKLKEGSNLELGENETKRIRITIKNGKIDATVEAVPDLDALSVDQLYALQEEYEQRMDELTNAEPNEEQYPDEHERWEDALDLLQQDLDEVENRIEELSDSDDKA